MCQKKTPGPAARRQTVAEFLPDNRVEEWWSGTEAYHSLMMWALQELEYTRWVTNLTFQIMVPIMFGADEQVPPGTSEAEMHRRIVLALRTLLPRLAAGHGYGPLKDDPAGIRGSLTAVAMASQIMQTGMADEAAVARKVADSMPTGFVIMDSKGALGQTLVKECASFGPAGMKELVEFLLEQEKRQAPLDRWLMILDPRAERITTARELLNRIKSAPPPAQ